MTALIPLRPLVPPLAHDKRVFDSPLRHIYYFQYPLKNLPEDSRSTLTVGNKFFSSFPVPTAPFNNFTGRLPMTYQSFAGGTERH